MDIAESAEEPWAAAAAARAAQERGALDQAVALWRACLARFPDHPERRWWLAMQGYALLEVGQTLAAGRSFAALVRDFPEEAQGHAGLGYVAERLWRWGPAILHWERCLAVTAPPELPARLARKALCLAEIGRVEEALALVERAAAMEPPHVEALEARARLAELWEPPARARERWAACIMHCPDEIRGWLGGARQLGAMQAFDAARTLLDRAVERWPEAVGARTAQAGLAVAMRQWAPAERLWRETLRLFPESPEALRGCCGWLGARGRWQEAQDLVRERTAPGPRRAACLLELALASRDLAAALDHLGELIEAAPHDPALRLRAAEIHVWRSAPGDPERAVAILEALLAGSPDSVAIKTRLIEAQVRSGAEDAALALLAGIPAADRRREVAVLRAWRCHRRGDAAAAKLVWRGILERSFVPAVHAPPGELRRIARHGGATGEEILLFSVVRNELPRLPWFLGYYRRLGVERFVLVDNGSDDGTTELLLAQPDVLLYRTEESFALAAYGMRWLNQLLERHGGRSWCLYVDADEALVYPGSEERDLRQLVRHLARARHEVMFAVMLDMFPARLDTAGAADGADGAAGPTPGYDWFDPPRFHPATICPYVEVSGGARERLFGRGVFLSKVPLVWGGAGIRYLMNHRTTPGRVADVTGALLHHHLAYLLDERQRHRVQREAERGEHSDHAVDRAHCLALLPELGARADLRGPASVRFESSRQLVELGILRTGAGFAQA